MGYKRINELSKILVFFVGLVFCYCSIYAQPGFLCTDSLSRPTLIFHANIGFGVSPSKLGESAWNGVDNKDESGITCALRLTRCLDKLPLGYGIYVFGYTDHKKFQLPEVPLLKEKVQIEYIAPQLSYIRKKTAFPNCFGIIGLGVGYMHYRSRTVLSENVSYETRWSGVGINADIGYEYAFLEHWGAKLEIGSIFSPIRPMRESAPEHLLLQPRSKINLFLIYAQIGISCYL